MRDFIKVFDLACGCLEKEFTGYLSCLGFIAGGIVKKSVVV